ncbi:MAG TPA: energy transducer TonB [Verrucomicrobiae bacterium]|nr:energy transducer TonB [Verrucomicrobiae bacterium]
MSSSALSGQPTVLEVPVTVQGSKPVEGTDKRELFFETTKTALVFENGAVLNMKSKVLPGQCVFVRNELSGKEVLCKVVESAEREQSGFTELEFNVYEPEFWGSPAGTTVAGGQEAEAQKGKQAAVENPEARPKIEPSAPVGIETQAAETAPAGVCETKEAAAETAPESEGRETKAEDAKSEPANVEGQAAREAEAAKEVLGEREPEAASPLLEELEEGEAGPETAGEMKKVSPAILPMRVPNFKARKIAAAISVTAAVIIVSVQIYDWHSKFGHSIHTAKKSVAALAAAKKSVPPPAAPNGAPAAETKSTAGTEISANSKSAGTAPAPAIEKLHEPAIAAKTAAPAASQSEPSRIKISSEHAGLRRGREKKPQEVAAKTVPPRIVLATQPPIPSWAKMLDLDGVVQLDAVIDAKGNLTQTRLLSGSQLLQQDARQAVALWLFEPGTADGKPTTAHLVLTVQFQR